MCDDYDTDFESAEEEFERENLIDDIKKIQLALARSDVEEEDDDEEEEEEEEEEDNTDFIETSSFKYQHSSLTSTNVQERALHHRNTDVQGDSDVQPTLTELVPVTVDIFREEQENRANLSIQEYPLTTDQALSQSVNNDSLPAKETPQEPVPSSCHGNVLETGDSSVSTVPAGQEVPVVPSPCSTFVAIPVSVVCDELGNIRVMQEQPPDDFAQTAVQEEINDGDDDVDVSSLGLKDVIELSLAQNRQYQSQVLKVLQSIEAALEDNKLKQMSLNQAKLSEEEEIQQALPTLVSFSAPYFRDADGHGHPGNEDSRQLRSHIASGAYQTKAKTWNAKEKKLLAEGVRMQNLKNKLSPLLMSLKEAQSNPDVDPVEVSLLNTKIKEIRELSPRALEQDLECLNWEKLSSEYLPRRQAIECQLHWCHFGHPRVNRKQWTKQEDKMLLQLAKDKNHDDINWNDIAQTLQTNRTPLQCYQRFQRSLNKEILRSKWTPEEDEQLTELVKVFGEGNWQRIADYLDGRMGEQCMNRYMKACKPARKGRWTQEENDSLMEAVRIVGKLNWEKVSEYVSGRTGTQCRERYMNVLNPTLKKGPWDKEEDEKLLQLVDEHGGSWSMIAKEFVNRSDNQCWRRWKALRKEESLYYRMNTLRKKREMVANFVGRRQEKPTLRPEDLDIQDIPIKVPSRSQRKVSHQAGSKMKRIKTERIEIETEESHDENQDSQPTSTSSSATSIMTPLVNTSNISHMNTSYGDGTAPGTSHVITAEESGQRVMGNPAVSPKEVRKIIKRRISESSDEDWDENDVVIDIRELGNRMSTRKRRHVNYLFDDDLGSDFSQDEEKEEDEDDSQVLDEPVDKPDQPVRQAKQVAQTIPEPRKRIPGDQDDATDAPGFKSTTTNSKNRKAITRRPSPVPIPASIPAPAPVPASIPGPVPLPTPASIPVPAPAPAPAPAPDSIPGPSPVPTPASIPVPTPVRVPVQSQVQGSVASFSLLLQAFNINVSAVLQKVKPASSQDAVHTSDLTAASTATGQQSPSTSSASNTDKSSCGNKSGTSLISSQCVPLSLKMDNTSSQTTGDRSVSYTKEKAEQDTAKAIDSSSTKRTVDSPAGRVVLRFPSKRKATIPRKTRRFSERQNRPQNLSDRIENIIQQNEKVLATTKLSKQSVSYRDNRTQTNGVKRPQPPAIPPLPPCLTTLKGFKTLMAIKGQLENLARMSHGNLTHPSTSASTSSISPSSAVSMGMTPVTQASPLGTSSVRATSNMDRRVISCTSTDSVVKTSTSTVCSRPSPTNPSATSTPSYEKEETRSKDTVTTLPVVASGISTTIPVPSGSRSHTAVDPKYPPDSVMRYSSYRKAPEYKLLAGRFQSLFLWPMFMSKVPVVGKVPKDLFKVPSGQYTQNWGFPRMFALPGPAPPVASSGSITGRNTSAKTSSSRKRSKKGNSSSTVTNSSPGPERSPQRRIASSSTARLGNESDKAIGKQTTKKTAPRSNQRNPKRASQSSSPVFSEDVMPRKKRKTISAILADNQVSESTGTSATTITVQNEST